MQYLHVIDNGVHFFVSQDAIDAHFAGDVWAFRSNSGQRKAAMSDYVVGNDGAVLKSREPITEVIGKLLSAKRV